MHIELDDVLDYTPLQGETMPPSNLAVNGTSVEIRRYIRNSLTEEACKRYDIESVEIDIVHTNLDDLNLNIILPSTYGLIY